MKIALVHSKNSSQWVSCQSITGNLKRAYELSFSMKSFFFEKSQLGSDVYLTANQIFLFNPDKIVFIDHRPHPLLLLTYLKDIYPEGSLPPFYFHLFGDFPLYAENWMDVVHLLKGEKVHFYCASEKQRRYLQQFLLQEDVVSVVPFPEDKKKFFYQRELRDYWRDRLQLKDGEVAVVYTGRMSLQKNITTLIEKLSQSKEFRQGRVKLFLLGHFDHVGSPLFGVHFMEGHYFHHCKKVMEEIPLELREQIHFLGGFDHEELNGILCAADLFCSLSLHHDEDFGMSPLQALLTGPPTVLTDWGGFSSFHQQKGECFLLETAFDEKEIKIEFGPFFRAIELVAERGSLGRWEYDHHRQEKADLYQKIFSIESVGQHLKEIHQSESQRFQGFSYKLEVLGILMSKFDQSPPGREKYVFNNNQSKFYRDLYLPYLSSIENQ